MQTVGVLKNHLEYALKIELLVPTRVAQLINAGLTEARNLLTWLETKPTGSHKKYKRKYESLTNAVTNLEACLSDTIPKYRPCDIQTSDARPGVATSEIIVHLRMVEDCLLNDLDFHCCMYYAPRDSKSPTQLKGSWLH